MNDMDSDYYNDLVSDLSSPFYSRATQESLAPGSTFKMVTAIGALEEASSSRTPRSWTPAATATGTTTSQCWIYRDSGGYRTTAW